MKVVNKIETRVVNEWHVSKGVVQGVGVYKSMDVFVRGLFRKKKKVFPVLGSVPNSCK